MISFKNILVALDFGEPSNQALRMAIDLAKRYGASLTLMHTYEIPAYAYPGIEFAPRELFAVVADAAAKQLDEALAEVRKELPAAHAILKRGSPWREILATIEETKADLVVMGTHGRRGLGRAILGSVAEKVVRVSPAPVLTVGVRSES